MLNEVKILFKNIKNLRKSFINESISGNRIEDAIQSHEIIYIYYEGDETVQRGYRTIKPFVLGTTTAGNKAVRAWQDAGSSDGYRGIDRTPRLGHEKFTEPHGVQPGWRLFLLDNITSLMPTGKIFFPEKYFKVNGVEYKPNDGGMSSVDVAIQTDRDVEPEKSKTPNKFFKFTSQKASPISTDELNNWLNIARNYKKEAYRKFWVVELENGEKVLKTEPQLRRENIPDQAIVGNLKELYNEKILSKKSTDKGFFKDQQNSLEK